MAAKPSPPETREEQPPGSTVRDVTARGPNEDRSQDPSYDFYDELTEPLWSPPLLQPLVLVPPKPSLAQRQAEQAQGLPLLGSSQLEDPPVDHPPLISLWQWIRLVVTGG